MGLGATTTAAATAGVATTATTSTTAAATATGATIAASTTSVATEFTQSLVLGAARGAAMGGASAGIRGANPLRGLVEGAAFGALGRGVNSVLGESAQTLTGQTIHAVSSATLETTLHGGNILENVGIAVAANAVAHTVLPMDEEHMADLSPTQIYARAGLHAALASGSVAALNGSPDFVVNTFIAAVGALIEPAVSARGQQMGERVAQRSQSRMEGADTMRRPTQARRARIRRDSQQSVSRPEVEQALLARGVQALRARGEVIDERALLQAIRTALDSHSPASLRAMGEQAYATDLGFRREVMRQWQQSQMGTQGDAQVVLVSAAAIPLAVLGLIAGAAALSSLIMIQYNRSHSSGSTYHEPTAEQIQQDNAIPLEYIPGRRPAAATMGFMPLFEGSRLGSWTNPFPDHSGLIDRDPLIFPMAERIIERWISPAPDRTLTGTQILSFPIHQLDTRPEGRPIEAQGLQFMYRKHASSTTDRPHAPNRDVRYQKAPETLPAFPGAVKVDGMTPNGMGGTRAEWHYKGKIYQWDAQHAELEVYDSRGKKHFGSVDHITGKKRGDPKPGRNIRKYVN